MNISVVVRSLSAIEQRLQVVMRQDLAAYHLAYTLYYMFFLKCKTYDPAIIVMSD